MTANYFSILQVALDLATNNSSARIIYSVGRVKCQRRNTIGSEIAEEFDSSLFRHVAGLSSKKDEKVFIDKVFFGNMEYIQATEW